MGSQSSDKIVAFAILTTMCACAANVFFLEKLLGAAKNSSHLITFTGFFLISFEGFITTTRFGTVTPTIPIRYYFLLVTVFFISNVVNNLVFRYHIPMTLHMIFKSGSLMTNMVMGMVLLNKRYSRSKYLSVITVTLGIILCTYASSTQQETTTDDDMAAPYHEYVFGLVLLTCTLLAASYMGILQEGLVTQFGKHPRESLFYNHALPLPFFAFLWSDISQQITVFNHSELVTIPVLNIEVPYLWLLLAGNATSQYICVNSVFQLTSRCSSLTVTLVITVRKLLSLLISIFYFQNPFTALHWAGAALVFGGSAIFTDLHNQLFKQSEPVKEKAN